MKFIVTLIAISAVPAMSLACNNDFECGYGNQCVKPRGDYSLQGVCVTPVNQFGTQDYTPTLPRAKPHDISSCNFDTDCGLGFTCVKRSGAMYGICVK